MLTQGNANARCVRVGGWPPSAKCVAVLMALTEIAIRAGDARREALDDVLGKGNELNALLSVHPVAPRTFRPSSPLREVNLARPGH